MSDLVYYYHHPDQVPVMPNSADNDGFFSGLTLTMAAMREEDGTGRLPDALELAGRINAKLRRDVDHLREVIERGRPKPEQTDD